MTTEPIATALGQAVAVADAVLYEGYLLYPYRRSSAKNRFRWQFGVLSPRAWIEARGPGDEGVAGAADGWWQRTDCLVEAAENAPAPVVRCRVRFLQLRRRSVEERLPDGRHRAVDRLEIGTRLELGFDEAVPREFDLRVPVGERAAGDRSFDLRVPGGEDVETLVDDGGRPVGRRRLRRWPVDASVRVSVTRCRTRERLFRLRMRVENADRTTRPGAPRSEALRRSLIATHAILVTDGDASFLSLLDPPRWAEAEARACSNVHTFPVLAGGPGGHTALLSSPILLPDHPRIAPESPGDLHDATEIDEILSLRTLTLTDAEKREARATDGRAAAIVDRVEAMPPEILSRLHGAIRSLGPARRTAVDVRGDASAPAAARRGSVPSSAATPGRETASAAAPGAETWTDPAATPDVDGVIVGGRRVRRGSRVRLCPRRRGTDPQDMFVAGRTARVEAVLLDMDGSHHLAVTLEDDPGAELDRWYGRFRYFSPAEVEPLPDAGSAG